MSTISVSNIQTANGTENLTATTGNTTGSRVIVTAGGGVVVGANSTVNAIIIDNTTLANTLVTNSTGSFFAGNVSLNSLISNNSIGSAGQVLTSAGAGSNTYWSTISVGTNVDSTYAWTNTHTFAANVNFDAGTLFVDGTNNRVGITNTAPDAALTVGGTANVSGVARFGANVTLAGTLQTISGNVNIDAGTLFVDSAGNRVGVNTTTPDANLTVVGTANVSGVSRFAANVTLAGTLQTISGNSNFDSGVLFVDATNNRVGVGTTSPDANLAVVGTANVSGVARFGANVTVVGNLNIASTLANTGYAELNSGIKVNWGVIAANSSTLGNATFSSAFATGPYSVQVTGANSLGNTCWVAGTNATVVQVRSSNTSSTGGLVYYMAIGI